MEIKKSLGYMARQVSFEICELDNGQITGALSAFIYMFFKRQNTICLFDVTG